MRAYSSADRFIAILDHARLTLSNALPAERSNPATTRETTPDNTVLNAPERKRIGSYLRVNHTGEVCAQALYLGQASQASSLATRNHLLACAQEEQAHLQWCAQRLEQLQAKPSLFNPLWYGLSYGLGVGVARLSDTISLGFIHATENQVKRHLTEHLEKIPKKDKASRAILQTMLEEETRHAASALDHGGRAFPNWIQSVMWASSRIMTVISYRL